jgi:hypothetical protein
MPAQPPHTWKRSARRTLATVVLRPVSPVNHRKLVQFQEGPILENGVNGVTNEVLLAIVRDRLARFQSGPYSCRENALALAKIEEALHWLHHRTLSRTERNVEGTSKA